MDIAYFGAELVLSHVPVPICQVHAAIFTIDIVVARNAELSDCRVDGGRNALEFQPLEAVLMIMNKVSGKYHCIRHGRIDGGSGLCEHFRFIYHVGIPCIESHLRVGHLKDYSGVFCAAGCQQGH